MLFQNGLELIQKGREADALTLFRKLTEQDPGCIEAWNNRAVLEASKGDLEAANQSLEKALEARADISLVQRNLGKVRSRLARIAYDTAFGTRSTLPPLQLDLQREAGSASVDSGAVRQRDSLLTLVASLRETHRRELARRDSMVSAGLAEIRKLQGGERGPVVAAAEPVVASPVVVADPPPPQVRLKPKRSSETSEGVLDALQAWAQAWSSQDIERYLECYSSRYVPVGKMDRATWEANRRERLAAPKSIHVEVGGAKVRLLKDHRAEVVFRQVYQTESTRLTSRKRLEFAWERGAWKIFAEKEAR